MLTFGDQLKAIFEVAKRCISYRRVRRGICWGYKVSIHSSTALQIQAVREGLPYSSFVTLRDALELSTDELAQLLGIPRHTLTKRQQAGSFSPSESNALSRVARMYREATAFFGDDARTWLKTSLPALATTPLSLLDTDPGAEAVGILLRQLAWGVYP